MHQLYFAYGSNMLSTRLAARQVDTVAIGAAVLHHKCLAFNKPGIDRSGKANIVDSLPDKVWGVLYQISVASWPQLDAFEGGYDREPCEVVSHVSHNHGSCTANVYQWYGADCQIPPYDWYMDLVIGGAQENNFPASYIDFLRSIPTIQGGNDWEQDPWYVGLR